MRVPAPRGCFRGGGPGCPSSGSALLRAACQRQLLPAQEVVWGRWLRVRAGTLQPGVSALREATEESSLRESFALAAQAAPPPGGGGWAASVRHPAARVTACSVTSTVRGSGGWAGRTLRCGRWRPNGRIRPVLKHGPRSATCARVPGWQTRRRNESEGGASLPAVARAPSLPSPGEAGAHRRPIPVSRCGGI